MIKKPAPVSTGVNFGSLDFYVAGGGLPEGDYCWTSLDVKQHQATDRTTGVAKGESRLGVIITLQPLHDLSPEATREQFYSFGTGADKSYAPNPDTGKGIVAIPGGPAAKFNNSTNWSLLLKSLYDCGMPEGIFSNDVSVLEGIHVHMANIPEPAERKGFANKAATGEAATEERRANTVAVVAEIKDDGKPWEGTGGLPTAKAAPKAAVNKAANGKVQPIAAKAVAAAEGDEESIESAAISGVSKVLEAKPGGMSTLLLKVGAQNAIKAVSGEDMAVAVAQTFFADDITLGALLGTLGYKVAGGVVKPIA